MNLELFIGLMSGTSLDGIDAGLFDFASENPITLSTLTTRFPVTVQQDLLALCTPGDNEIERLGVLDNILGELYAKAVNQLLQQTGIAHKEVKAIGCHGQTLRHRPPNNKSGKGFTLQIGDPNTLAELTGITTVADFRRRDMAVAGQGAPLAPAFHNAVFGSAKENRLVLNIGGIANITILPAQRGTVQGFDTGPGNVLMDCWAREAFGVNYDHNGDFAAQGSVNAILLQQMLADAYFMRTPPKSTGREYFTRDWLQAHLNRHKPGKHDVMATLCSLTVDAIANDIQQYAAATQRVLVCGGGVHNRSLMLNLQHRFNRIPIESTLAYGIDPDFVEAAAFAWLAKQTLCGKSGNLPSVTGAEKPVILGGIYPGWASRK